MAVQRANTGGEVDRILSVERLLLTFFAAFALATVGAGISYLAPRMGLLPPTMRGIAETAGDFLLASGAASLLYRMIFDPLQRASDRAQIIKVFNDSLDTLAHGILPSGLRAVNQEMDFASLFDSLEKGDELWWLDTYAPSHKQWLARLRKALERGALIRMLILDPDSPLGTMRATEIGKFFTPARFHEELVAFLDDMNNCSKDAPAHAMEVRIYNDLLGCPIYLVKRKGEAKLAYSSLYLNVATGFGFPHLLWEQGVQSFLPNFVAYLDAKWSQAKPYAEPSRASRAVELSESR
jgi:hypothetical protein